jgi:maleylpyruvate isomerase
MSSPADCHNGAVISPEEALHELIAATGRLLGDLDGLSDAQVAGPSLLPGWTRGHVLTHLARNAEGGTRLLGWARTGVPSYEYESLEARAAAIEAGADRPAATLTRDVRRTADAFAAAATGMPAEAWQRVVRYTAGQEPRADVIVPSRLAEVLIHHVDLDLCYRPQDWPVWFTTDMLSRTATALTESRMLTSPVRLAGTATGSMFAIGADGPDSPVISPVISGPEYELMAWLFGRSDGHQLSRVPSGPLPEVPPIY